MLCPEQPDWSGRSADSTGIGAGRGRRRLAAKSTQAKQNTCRAMHRISDTTILGHSIAMQTLSIVKPHKRAPTYSSTDSLMMTFHKQQYGHLRQRQTN